MGRKSDEELTQDAWREVCLRTESRGLFSGSIIKIGTEYVIGLNAVNCQTGDTLAKEQSRTRGKEEVLKGLDKAASALRSKLGESWSSLQKFDKPLEEASTSSLEALQAYSAGIRTVLQKGSPDAVPFFRRAVELDPNFAIAYVALGVQYSNLSQPTLAADAVKRAHDLRERASEREKFLISAEYYFDATGQLEKVIDVCRVWSESYPRDWMPHNLMGAAYRYLGKHEKALAATQQALKLEGDDGIDYGNLAQTYLFLDRMTEAKSTFREAVARKVDDLFSHRTMYIVGFLEGDAKNMAEQAAWALRNPGAEDLLYAAQSDTEAYFGRLKKARELARLSVEFAERNDFKETAGLWQGSEAIWEAQFGNTQAARDQGRIALTISQGRDVRVLAALAMARGGDPSQARKLVHQLNANFPLDSLIQNYWLPTIRAEIQLQGGYAKSAIESLQSTIPYELGEPTSISCLYPIYIRGEAYLRIFKSKLAASEFEKILLHPGIMQNCPLGALAQLQLGRAKAMSGDRNGAEDVYKKFLGLWRDADPDIPILKEAKAEYAKLQ
jgi:tetratricopeptide (TPR) repeat protein